MNLLQSIFIWISPKFVPKGPIHSYSTLVKVRVWHGTSDEPLREPMMNPPAGAYICITQPKERPCDVYRCQWTGSPLVQAMVCPTAWSHHHNKCRVGNFNQNATNKICLTILTPSCECTLCVCIPMSTQQYIAALRVLIHSGRHIMITYFLVWKLLL